MTDEQQFIEQVSEECAGMRLDQVLAQLFPDYSRSRLQGWNKKGRITVDGKVLAAKTRLAGGEHIKLTAEVDILTQELKAEPVPLDIIYQDDHIIVINKPAGLVMHPGAGNRGGTVQNGLLHFDPALEQVPRAGIVHRLDKDTTGLFVVARTLKAHKSLVEQLQVHSVARHYMAIVDATLVSGGTVDLPIGRHPKDRLKMAVRDSGKEAITHYRIEEKFRAHTYLSVKLETGRTHQIRVHMSHIKHALIGDATYAGRPKFPPKSTEELREGLKGFKRQALHARQLALEHPETGEQMSWSVDIPEDMLQILALLREDTKLNG